MDRRYTKREVQDSDGSTPSEAWLFAQAILGKPVPNPATPEAHARARREFQDFVAAISPEYARQRKREEDARSAAAADRELLAWAAQISSRAEDMLRELRCKEAEQREAWRRAEQFCEAPSALLAEWNEADHPRAPQGTPTGGQWIDKGGGAGVSSSGAAKSRSFLRDVNERNRTIAELTGVVTPSMIRATRLTVELQSAARLPGDVARAASAGLLTGGKAVVNGFATAVKDVATLGLSPGQIELIGVTKEDRDHGYDTAVAISSASGQVLIAVGTGGMAAVLGKGGSIARTASGALVVFDAAGNAVGVIQGIYDASQNGITLANGVKVAGSALGLGANAKTARDLGRATNARRLAEIDEFVRTLPRTPTRTRTPADLYEIRHTGAYNYELSGGGAKFEIDGYRGSTILEAKHVGNPATSPFVPGSSCDERIRTAILNKVRAELARARTIINSGTTPFNSLEIVTNSQKAKAMFEAIMKELTVPGSVRFEP